MILFQAWHYDISILQKNKIKKISFHTALMDWLRALSSSVLKLWKMPWYVAGVKEYWWCLCQVCCALASGLGEAGGRRAAPGDLELANRARWSHRCSGETERVASAHGVGISIGVWKY